MDKDESLNLESPSETDKLAYTLFKSLDHEHVAAAAITCIAFSPDGTYIAGGADDGQISIWSNSGSLRLLHAISGKSSVLCIKWLDEDRLLGGMEDGVLACINIDKVSCNSVMPFLKAYRLSSLAAQYSRSSNIFRTYTPDIVR